MINNALATSWHQITRISIVYFISVFHDRQYNFSVTDREKTPVTCLMNGIWIIDMINGYIYKKANVTLGT